jgi:hypothetical protein
LRYMAYCLPLQLVLLDELSLLVLGWYAKMQVLM